MKHKFLVTTLASVMLASCFSAVASPTQSASAAEHSINSNYWHKNRKVMVLKTTTFRKFDKRRNKYVRGRKKYTPGSVIKLRSAGEFEGWVLAGTHARSRYWWISTKSNSKWMTEYYKMYSEHWNSHTYTDSYGSKFTIKSLKRLSVFNYDNETSKPDKTYLVLTAKLDNNGPKTTPINWIESNLFIYPEGTNNDHMLIDGGSSELLRTINDDFSNSLSERKDKLPKNYYTTFKVQLTGDKQDLNANTYVFDDDDGHKIEIPVQSEKVEADDED